MITQQFGFSVLSAPIAATDRRALSQAWYSALHLARPKSVPASGTPEAKHPMQEVEASSVHGRMQTTRGYAGTSVIKRHADYKETPAARGFDVERRAFRSPLARRIEHVFLHPAKAPQRAILSIEGGGA